MKTMHFHIKLNKWQKYLCFMLRVAFKRSLAFQPPILRLANGAGEKRR